MSSSTSQNLLSQLHPHDVEPQRIHLVAVMFLIDMVEVMRVVAVVAAVVVAFAVVGDEAED